MPFFQLGVLCGQVGALSFLFLPVFKPSRRKDNDDDDSSPGGGALMQPNAAELRAYLANGGRDQPGHSV